MMRSDAMIFTGRVVHKRLRPKPHALNYRVFSFLLDIGKLDAVSASCRLFSRNRFNVFSFYDKDHGPGDGTPVLDIARESLTAAGRPFENRRILLLAYPRIFGFVFNPLSVFYVYAPDDALETVVYEVNNTFGERTSYVVAAGEAAGHVGGDAGGGGAGGGSVYAQSCVKEMFVSPFASGRGGYKFRITDPAAEAVVAVLLSDADGALIKTHFRGAAKPMRDMTLAGLLVRYPLLTFKVVAAIHFEALKLWLKGVPLSERHVSPRYTTTPVQTGK
jgi:uncharacterized protein